MTNPAMELARQRAMEEANNGAGVTTNPVTMPGWRRSDTDWGELRSPSDPNSDGGVSVIALPPMHSGVDDGGLGGELHPSNQPIKKLIARPANELTEDERKLVFDHLLEKERLRQEQRDNLAFEQEKFTFEKKKSVFSMVKKFIIGFGILAASSFTALIGVLIWVSIKNTNFGDTSILPAILNTFTNFFNVLVNM